MISRERDRAELETAKATAINDFLRDMLIAVDPWASGDHDLTVVEAMDAARADVDSIFAEQPLVAAEMHATMGQTYLGLQKLTEAEQEVRQGLEMNTDTFWDRIISTWRMAGFRCPRSSVSTCNWKRPSVRARRWFASVQLHLPPARFRNAGRLRQPGRAVHHRPEICGGRFGPRPGGRHHCRLAGR